MQTDADERSAATSKASLIGIKQRESQLKAKILKFIRQLDESNTGLIKQPLFFSLLNCINSEAT
jgi:hypothetical protein